MRFVCDACMFAGLNATLQGHLGSADIKEAKRLLLWG